jgi:hypothetical protein
MPHSLSTPPADIQSLTVIPVCQTALCHDEKQQLTCALRGHPCVLFIVLLVSFLLCVGPAAAAKKPPTSQSFSSVGSGTYTTPRSPAIGLGGTATFGSFGFISSATYGGGGAGGVLYSLDLYPNIVGGDVVIAGAGGGGGGSIEAVVYKPAARYAFSVGRRRWRQPDLRVAGGNRRLRRQQRIHRGARILSVKERWTSAGRREGAGGLCEAMPSCR